MDKNTPQPEILHLRMTKSAPVSCDLEQRSSCILGKTVEPLRGGAGMKRPVNMTLFTK